MPPVNVTVESLQLFAPEIQEEKAGQMIADAVAMAAAVAPCITEDGFEFAGAAEAIIRGAILRWNDSGSGAVTQVSAGPFSQSIDTRSGRKSLFWPSELNELQRLCAAGSGSAFSIDTTPPGQFRVLHSEMCSARFGGNFCDCGAVLNTASGGPLW